MTFNVLNALFVIIFVFFDGSKCVGSVFEGLTLPVWDTANDNDSIHLRQAMEGMWEY